VADSTPGIAHVWILFLVVNAANGAIWWVRGRPYRERDPSLTEGYRSLIRGWILLGSVPWLIFGAGLELGGLTPWSYFHPESSNPYVTAWFGSIVLLWLAGVYWVFARGGAEQLSRHPGLLRNVRSPAGVKLLCGASVGGGLIALVAMYLK
jgi:hypothetical protein